MTPFLFFILTLLVVTLFSVIVYTHFRRNHRGVATNSIRGGSHSDMQVARLLTDIFLEDLEIWAIVAQVMALLKTEFGLTGIGMMFFGPYLKQDWKTDGLGAETPTAMLSGDIHRVMLQHSCIYDNLTESNLKTFMKKHNFAATFPIKLKNQPIGVLVFGPKVSNGQFSRLEIDLVELLSSILGIGIKNVIAFIGVKQFNEELKQNVKERTQEIMSKQKREIEKSNEVARLKDEFIFFASHELRIPINEIRKTLENTLKVPGMFPKDVEAHLRAAQEANTHIDQLVNDLLAVARNNSDELFLKMEPSDFYAILSDVLFDMKSLMNEKNITLHQNLKDLPLVSCDQTKTREVLLRLVGNAIEYSKQGGNVFMSAYRIPGEHFMIFEIIDDGIGMQKELQKKIFQKFLHAAAPGAKQSTDEGLGLFVTRMLVEKMGGKIMFNSSVNGGTTFSFTLPLAD